MIKIITASILAFSLTGCYQVVNQYDINRAIKYCGSKENILEITAGFLGEEYATCLNKPGERLSTIKD